ncbi:cytochrome c biogenesis protein CcsA [Rickettsiella endosymbiont of Xylota segnis]|uniref:cytochrome c biogenesis protein CcsA n=1 Tax=Rickettsiella endosymbiont of Xylota segnis TaxID=3066238 RepID=UPI0030CE2005
MVSYADFIHIFLSTLALIVLISAALQALLLASQEWMLKNKQAIGFIQYFPPLEVMETYLFMLISIAIVLLTLILASSLILFHPVFGQRLWQKILLSLLAWGVLLMLLIGRNYFGWRGKIAISWTLIGASLIGIVYLGTILFMPNL